MSWLLDTAYSLLESVGYRPRELYTFGRNNQFWHYTSGARPITVDGITYTPCIMTRDKIERTDETRGNTVTIRVLRSAPVIDALREVHSRPMTLRIQRTHFKDIDIPSPITEAEGDIVNVRLLGPWVEFELDTGDSVWDKPFPSRLVSRQNPWETFGENTGINEDDFSFETTIAAIERSKITVAAKAPGTADGYYDGGKIRIGAIADRGEPMYVRYSVGLDFFINGRALSGLSVGDTVTLVAGDDKSLITARDKFGQDAVKTFGGFDLLPTTDPLQTGLDNLPLNRSPYADAPTTTPGTVAGGFPESFLVNYFQAESPEGVSVWVDITDPLSALVSVEARTNSTGFTPDWTAWSAVPLETVGGHRYRVDASKSPVGFVAVEYRITYIDPGDMLEHSEVLSLQYTTGIPDEITWLEGPGIEPPDQVDFALPFGKVEARCYLTMTHDDTMNFGSGGHRPYGFALNMNALVSIDGRAGPFTLHFPADIYVDDVLTPSISIGGLKYFQVTELGDGSISWTTRT